VVCVPCSTLNDNAIFTATFFKDCSAAFYQQSALLDAQAVTAYETVLIASTETSKSQLMNAMAI